MCLHKITYNSSWHYLTVNSQHWKEWDRKFAIIILMLLIYTNKSRSWYWYIPYFAIDKSFKTNWRNILKSHPENWPLIYYTEKRLNNPNCCKIMGSCYYSRMTIWQKYPEKYPEISRGKSRCWISIFIQAQKQISSINSLSKATFP